MRQFAKNTFLYLAEINFLDNKDAAPILQSARSIDDFVSMLSLLTSSPIIPGKTLLFFDEIQEAPDLITAVKFLVEDGRFPVVLSESMLGTELKGYRSFPVGYVHIERMFPLDFEEFCWAQGVSRYHRHHIPLQRRLAARPQPAHTRGSRRQPLTTTEFSIAMLLNRGWTIKEIASFLGVSDNTVKTHTRRVYAKLGIENRRELSRFMLR